ncbi:hypothetical protein C6499_08375 [Candidatus Poribacteria bacterium]|nr:MAG: hypothetical protein C6499_08375 [Candidatus Poribacteria bacterium]
MLKKKVMKSFGHWQHLRETLFSVPIFRSPHSVFLIIISRIHRHIALSEIHHHYINRFIHGPTNLFIGDPQSEVSFSVLSVEQHSTITAGSMALIYSLHGDTMSIL